MNKLLAKHRRKLIEEHKKNVIKSRALLKGTRAAIERSKELTEAYKAVREVRG